VLAVVSAVRILTLAIHVNGAFGVTSEGLP
jgi:hypothetical protein